MTDNLLWYEAPARLWTDALPLGNGRLGAMVFGQVLTTGGDIAEVEAWPKKIAAVTRDQVNEAAKRLLRDERSVTGLLLPAKPGEATMVADPNAEGAQGLIGGSVR